MFKIAIIYFLFTAMAPAFSQVEEEKLTNSCIYNDHGATPVEIMNLYNMVANAVSYGVVTNGIRNGSGVSDPVVASRGEKAPEDEGPYFQALRLFSLMDWDFGRALRHDKHFRPLPREMWMELAPMKDADLEKLGGEEILSTALPVPYLPNINNIKVTRLKSTSDSAAEKKKFKQAMLSGLKSGSTPFGLAVELKFPKSASKSRAQIEAYLPPLLHFKRQELPGGPIVTYLATLDEVGYLESAPEAGVENAIKVEMFKSFTEEEKNKLKVRISFGRLVGDKDITFDHNRPEDALKLSGKFKWQIKDNDYYVVKKFKEWFNRKVAPYDLEARFHQVSLELARKGEETLGQEARHDHRMEPRRFIMDETHISYRLKRDSVEIKDVGGLRTAGFTCDKKDDGRFECHQDFATWKDLEKGFLRRSLFVKVAAMLTNWDLVKSLPDLQKQVDSDLENRLNQMLIKGMEHRRELLTELKSAMIRP